MPASASEKTDGASHQCLEDIALMRGLPGMVVMCPSDDVEARKCVRAAVLHDGPVYMRFGRAAVPVINDPDMDFKIGKGTLLREGKDVTIVATGLCVNSAMEAAGILEQQGISAEVIDICTIKPLDEELLLASAAKTKHVVTAEETLPHRRRRPLRRVRNHGRADSSVRSRRRGRCSQNSRVCQSISGCVCRSINGSCRKSCKIHTVMV